MSHRLFSFSCTLLRLFFFLAATASFAQNNSAFGGPYPLSPSKYDSKVAAFGVYYGKEIFWSEGVELTEDLLEQSMDTNKNFPYGDRYQRYNYAIVSGRIYVTRWAVPVALNRAGDTSVLLCAVTQDGFPVTTAGCMLNTFPEATTIEESQGEAFPTKSPCSMLSPPNKLDGILDALSKHFMMSQEKKVIQAYDPKVWTKTEVAYAGEILLDIKACNYTLNNNSGTYKPAAGEKLEYLRKVAAFFKKKIGVAPAFIQHKLDDRVPFDPDAKFPWCQ